MRYFRVELGGFKPWLYADSGDLGALRKSWIQQEQHWTVFFFDHDGVLSINNRPVPYQVGNFGFVPPGTKAEFFKTGPGTQHYSLTFELVARTEVVAVPAVADLGDLADVRRREFENAADWLHTSIMRGIACAYNLIWSVAQPISVFRKSDIVFDAEDFINRKLAEPIKVAQIAAELGISQSQLLRMFQDEHQCTVQQFVRQRRGERAKHLLMTTDMPVKQIATKTGMADLQYFNKVVRSLSGHSPRELRRQSEHRTQH